MVDEGSAQPAAFVDVIAYASACPASHRSDVKAMPENRPPL